MKNPSTALLPDFYFGSLEETQRLKVEADLLSDPELLLDYLDLKRAAESAPSVPMEPSASLWNKLAPKTKRRRLALLSFAVGAAAIVAFVILMFPSKQSQSDQVQ